MTLIKKNTNINNGQFRRIKEVLIQYHSTHNNLTADLYCMRAFCKEAAV
jgi:hypothetical protein